MGEEVKTEGEVIPGTESKEVEEEKNDVGEDNQILVEEDATDKTPEQLARE